MAKERRALGKSYLGKCCNKDTGKWEMIQRGERERGEICQKKLVSYSLKSMWCNSNLIQLIMHRNCFHCLRINVSVCGWFQQNDWFW